MDTTDRISEILRAEGLIISKALAIAEILETLPPNDLPTVLLRAGVLAQAPDTDRPGPRQVIPDHSFSQVELENAFDVVVRSFDWRYGHVSNGHITPLLEMAARVLARGSRLHRATAIALLFIGPANTKLSAIVRDHNRGSLLCYEGNPHSGYPLSTIKDLLTLEQLELSV